MDCVIRPFSEPFQSQTLESTVSEAEALTSRSALENKSCAPNERIAKKSNSIDQRFRRFSRSNYYIVRQSTSSSSLKLLRNVRRSVESLASPACHPKVLGSSPSYDHSCVVAFR